MKNIARMLDVESKEWSHVFNLCNDISSLNLFEMSANDLIELYRRLSVVKMTVPGSGEVLTEFLEEYTNGEYERVYNELLELKKGMTKKGKEDFVAEMVRTIKDGMQKLESYYNRMHLLNEAAECLKQMGYYLDWFISKANMPTNELVYHFRDQRDEYSLVITAKDTDEPNEFLIESDIFYDGEKRDKAAPLGQVMGMLRHGCRCVTFGGLEEDNHGLNPTYNNYFTVQQI